MFSAAWYFMQKEEQEQKEKLKKSNETVEWTILLAPILFFLIFFISALLLSLLYPLYAQDLSGREIAERSRGLRQQIDDARQRDDNRGLRQWIKRRWEAQQNAVKAEEKRRAKSRGCLYISSGICRRQIPTAPRHWSSVKKRRHARQRSRALARCRANCYNRQPVQLERRSP